MLHLNPNATVSRVSNQPHHYRLICFHLSQLVEMSQLLPPSLLEQEEARLSIQVRSSKHGNQIHIRVDEQLQGNQHRLEENCCMEPSQDLLHRHSDCGLIALFHPRVSIGRASRAEHPTPIPQPPLPEVIQDLIEMKESEGSICGASAVSVFTLFCWLFSWKAVGQLKTRR